MHHAALMTVMTALAMVLSLAAVPEEDGKEKEKPKTNTVAYGNLDLDNYDLNLDNYGEVIDLNNYEEIYDYGDLEPKVPCLSDVPQKHPHKYAHNTYASQELV